MVNWRFWKSHDLAVVIGSEANSAGSSSVESSFYHGDWLAPKVSFAKEFEYYESIPKLQNVVEKAVAAMSSRDWSFEAVDETTGKQYTIPLDAWADKYNLDRLIKYYARNSMIAGTFLVGISDWQPVQMKSVVGLQRDEYGNILKYAKTKRNSAAYEELEASEFLKDDFIELDREPWGLSLFHALFNDQYTDVDGEKPLSMASIFRQLPQNFHKIIHKLGSPRIFYAFDTLDDEQLKKEAKKLMIKPGNRAALNKIPQIIPETIDGKGRFTDHTDFINKNFEAGTGSAANRLITEPSAMADGREATAANDDELVRYISANFLNFMNDQVIPAVLGEEARGKVLFRWGSKEDFDFNEERALQWLQAGVIGRLEVREMLKGTNTMKLDDKLFEKDQEQKAAEQAQQVGQKGNPPAKKAPEKKEPEEDKEEPEE